VRSLVGPKRPQRAKEAQFLPADGSQERDDDRHVGEAERVEQVVQAMAAH